MRLPRDSGRTRSGRAAVEAAISLPLLLTMLLGMWDVGRMVEVKQILDNAAREGGRQASTGLVTNSQAQQAVLSYLQTASIPTTHAVVTVSNLTEPSVDAADATQFDQLQVTVTVPFGDVRWIPTQLVLSSTSPVTGQALWWSMNDKAYPTPSPPPIE